MSNQYTWTIEAMDCYPSAEGQTNVVYNLHWRCTATSSSTYTNAQGQSVPYTAQIYNTQQVTYTGGAFTPFASLTQAEVIGWLQTALGAEQVTAIEASLDGQINLQINPTTITPKLPWSN